jgi:nicotinate-nucleotide--dimethylbenzimidazole phosphoribosyltransferase
MEQPGNGFPQITAVDHEAADRIRTALGAEHGRVTGIAAWIAGTHPGAGRAPIRQPVAVLLAADHGVAAAGVEPAGPSTAELLTSLISGHGSVPALAERGEVRLRIEDIAADIDTPGASKVRRGSGRIDQADALTAEETQHAIRIGRDLADQEADAGTDFLLLGHLGAASSVAVAALAGVVTGSEPITMVGRDDLDAARWMRRTAAIRDAMRRGTPYRDDPVALVQHIGGADIACAAGLLAQAAVRRTPVLLDGALPAVSGLLAAQLAPGSAGWWAAASSSPDPAQAVALAALGLEPLLDLGLRSGSGVGALIALQIVRAALDVARTNTC